MKDKRQLVGIAALAAVAVVGGVMLFGTANPSVVNTRTGVDYGADLQAAINAASTGDTLQLADTTYVCNCVDNKGLTILGPAKIVSPNADSALTYPPATPPATLRNLEIYGSGTVIHAIITYGGEGVAQDTFDEQPQGLTIDNVWVHGLTSQEVQRCVAANGRNFRFINSRATDCHGKGYDTQAIAVWNGSGPFTITDSVLEAAGENVMFGGAWASIPGLVPDGIEVRRNHFAKPLEWKGVWTVKNLFELKNARHVVVDGNTFDGNWTDAQAGWAIQFTPRPSDSGSWAVIEDVQFTNNIVRNSGQGINMLGADQAPAPTDVRLKRVRVANNLWDNINGPQFGSSGTFVTVTNGADSITVENNTAIQTGSIVTTDYAPSTNFIYRNNISRHNEYGIFGSGKSTGNPTIDYYFPGAVVTGNQFAKEVNPPSNVESMYPAGNFFPATLATVVDMTTFRSLVAGAGADIDAINAAQGGGPSVPSPTATATATSTPAPIGESPNNTRVPPAAQVVDTVSAAWTKASTNAILRNGAATGGVGSTILYCNHLVYVFGTDSQWYLWANGWQAKGAVDPCGGTPTPTPSATVTPAPTATPAPTQNPPNPNPSPSPSPCQPTNWPNSVNGQNSQMQTRRAQGCWPYNRTNNGMEYRRP